MAAFLSLRGYMFDLRKDGESALNPTTGKPHPIGTWVFQDRDGKLGDEVKDYNEGTARVHPARFLEEVTNVRKAMFEFLGIPKRRF